LERMRSRRFAAGRRNRGGEKKMKRLTPMEVFTGVSGTAVALPGSPLFLKGFI
jgi:hypothetical protein